MRLNQNQESSNKTSYERTASAEVQNVGRLVSSIIDSIRPKLAESNITLESDFDEFEAAIDPSLVRIVTSALLKDATESLVGGGQISVTLIEGQHQWELEVADSRDMSSNQLPDSANHEDHDLPTVVTYPIDNALRIAHRAALAHQGEIQTWNCPQGGMAHVFVASRYIANSSTHQTCPENIGPNAN